MNTAKATGVRMALIPATRRLVLVGSAGAIVVLAIARGAGALPTPSFGGGDAGAQSAVTRGSAAPVASMATEQGVTVRATGIVADDTRTVIGVVVEGRDDLGDTVFPEGPATLSDQAGRTYAEVGGSASQANRREKTIIFPPLAANVSDVTLRFDGLQFVRHAEAVAGSVGEVPVRSVAGTWSMRIRVPGGPRASQSVPVDHVARFAGIADVVIDEVRQAESGTVVRGHLDGTSPDEVPNILIDATLVDALGRAVPMIGLHMGYGDRLEQFEIRFDRTVGPVRLQVSPVVRDKPRDPVMAEALRARASGAHTGEWELSLPQ